MKYKYFYIIIFFFSCNFISREKKIDDLLKSNNKTNIIKACNLMSKQSDTIFISKLLVNPYDSRVSHHLCYKGISVYQAKMNALNRILNLSPPNEISYKLDSINVEFYLKWANEKNIIK